MSEPDQIVRGTRSRSKPAFSAYSFMASLSQVHSSSGLRSCRMRQLTLSLKETGLPKCGSLRL